MLVPVTATRRLTLEIEPGSDPITGRLSDELASLPFSGWLELATVLQSVLDPARDPCQAGDGEP